MAALELIVISEFSYYWGLPGKSKDNTLLRGLHTAPKMARIPTCKYKFTSQDFHEDFYLTST